MLLAHGIWCFLSQREFMSSAHLCGYCLPQGNECLSKTSSPNMSGIEMQDRDLGHKGAERALSPFSVSLAISSRTILLYQRRRRSGRRQPELQYEVASNLRVLHF